MNIKTTSIHARLYRWFYAVSERKLPSGFCEFFPRLVWMYIAIIPYVIISLPTIIIEKIDFKEKSESNSERWAFGLCTWFALWMVSGLVLGIVKLFFDFHMNKGSFLWGTTFIGVGFFIALIIVGIIFLIGRGVYLLVERYKLNPNMMSEYIKAKKEKYCPKINWIRDRD